MKMPRHATVNAWDEHGSTCEVVLADEQPLTVYVNDQALVTLMTSGAYPEALAIGYLRNQRLLQHLDDVIAIKTEQAKEQTKEQTEEQVAVRVTMRKPLHALRAAYGHSGGCGIGSTFLSAHEGLTPFTRAEQEWFSQGALATFLARIETYQADDKKMGAVHACALVDHQGKEVIYFVEDVSRHNAVDTVAGLMWMAGVSGENHVFYTTGRITSEIVLKIAHMGIPVIVSRSVPSKSGCAIAEALNMIIIGRARHQQYLLFGNPAGFQKKS